MDALTTSAPSKLLTGVGDSRPEIPVAEPLAQRIARHTAAIRVAAAQFTPMPGDTGANLARIDRLLSEAARNGARLVVFPECAVTGQVFAERAAALAVALANDDDALRFLGARCRAEDVECVVGALARTGDHLTNAAFLLGPAGLIGRYDKAHLPAFGADRYVVPGRAGFRVFHAACGRVGILIGYDLSFPEAARALALAGAEIIAVPAAWSDGSEDMPDYLARARARENRVFVVAGNRVGAERGAHFIGRSCIIGADGARLAEAAPDDEHIVIAEIDPTDARNKRTIIQPGVFETDVFADRRPDLYGHS